MADYKYMSQEKSSPGTKVGGREITYKGSEMHSNGRTVVGNSKGHQEHLSSPVITHTDGKIKPLHASASDGEVVTKTETIVEYTRVPMVMAHGATSPSISTPVGTTVSHFHQQPPIVDENIPNAETEGTRTFKTGPLNNLYWWYKPSPNGGIYDTGGNKHNTPTDGRMRHQHYHHQHGRNERALLGKHDTEQMKSGTVTMAPTQNRLPSPAIQKVEVLPLAIDSKQAARRYGGLATTEVEAYVPAIDSREAAWKYRGEVL